MTETTALRRIVTALLGAGYTVQIDDSNDGSFGPRRAEFPHTIVRDMQALADGCTMRVWRGSTHVGAILFVFGNDPSEVMADWSHAPHADGEQFNALLETFMD